MTVKVFHSSTCPYDVILGMEFLYAIRMKFGFKYDVIQCLDVIVDMKNIREFKNFLNVEDIGLQPLDTAYLNQLCELNKKYGDIEEDDFLCDDALDLLTTEILEQKHEKVTAKKCCSWAT